MTTKITNEAQTTNSVLMIYPKQFGFNAQTAESNTFQNRPKSEIEVQNAAIKEFDNMVETLKSEDISVYVCPSPEDKLTPDAIFPNNWISFHQDKVYLYPMLAPNRREERQLETVKKVVEDQSGDKLIKEVIDISPMENEGVYLEGTGSLVLDRENRVAFANISARTHKKAVEDFAQKTGYEVVTFHSKDLNDQEVYHTNVVMSVGDKFTVVCLSSMTQKDKQKVTKKLEELNKELIDISLEQMANFCGNIIELKSNDGQPKIIMSEAAFKAFEAQQIETLKKYGKIVTAPIPTIESVGGGSARCMIAEIF
jgi:hypothetical protein